MIEMAFARARKFSPTRNKIAGADRIRGKPDVSDHFRERRERADGDDDPGCEAVRVFAFGQLKGAQGETGGEHRQGHNGRAHDEIVGDAHVVERDQQQEQDRQDQPPAPASLLEKGGRHQQDRMGNLDGDEQEIQDWEVFLRKHPSRRDARRISLQIDGDRQERQARDTGLDDRGRQHLPWFAQQDEQDEGQRAHHGQGRPQQRRRKEHQKDRRKAPATQMQGQKGGEPPAGEPMVRNPENLCDEARVLEERVPPFKMERHRAESAPNEKNEAIQPAEENEDGEKPKGAPLKCFGDQIEDAAGQAGVLDQHADMREAQPAKAPQGPRQLIHAKGRAQEPRFAIPEIGRRWGGRQVSQNCVPNQPVLGREEDMPLAAKEAKRETCRQTKGEKRQVNRRRKEAVPARRAQDDGAGAQAGRGHNRARQQAQAHGEHQIARQEHKRTDDDETGERQTAGYFGVVRFDLAQGGGSGEITLRHRGGRASRNPDP